MPELLAQVTALCDEALGRLGEGAAHDRVTHAKTRLLEPLRVAIAGNVNAGKSTLLNALLGERIAPTEQGECTQVVTWFFHGFPQRAEIVFHDARRPRQPLPFEPGGRLPLTLGVDPEAVDRIEVHRSNAVLEKMILIDTPGLGSANAHISKRTEEMLARRSMAAADRADALIYVMTQLVRTEDQAAISAFRAQFPGQTGSAVNAVGVLNKADKGSGGREQRRAAAAGTASRYADELSALLTGIVPMVGLLAETAVRLDEDDARALRTLARADAAEREWMLEEREDFMRVEVDVPDEQRARLWEMLDVYGLECCFEWIDQGVAGAKALRARLAEASGIAALAGLIDDTLGERSDVLRVGAAIGQLEAVAYSVGADASARAWLRDALDDLRLEPAWHELAGLRALRAAAALETEIGVDRLSELRRLVTGHTPAERLGLPHAASRSRCADVALEGVGRWRRATVDWADDAPELARIGKVAQRSLTLILKEVRG